MTKYEKMTTMPVEGLICRLAVPTIISMLISSFYNMADTYFVSNIKSDQASTTGAIGVIFSFMSLIQAFSFFFGQGSGNYMSKQLGQKNTKEAEKMASTGFFTAIFISIFIMIFGLVFIDGLAFALGSTPTILPYAKSYLFFILLGTPFITSSFVLNNQLRFQGSAFYGMMGMATGAVINLILDPIFIFILDMNVSGAGLATFISQFISFCILLAMTSRSDNIRIRLRSFSPSLKHYGEIIKFGFPSLCRQGLASIAILTLNKAAGFYGDYAISAMSIVSRITMFAGSALIGFGQGFQPVCGFNYGAGLYSRVKKSFWFCVKLSFIFLLAVAVFGFIFADGIIRKFGNPPQEIVTVAVTALKAQCITLPTLSWTVLSNMCLQNLGKFIRASFVSMSRQGIFLIPLLIILPKFMGIQGIETAQAISDLIAFAFALPIQLSVMHELNQPDRQA